MLNWVRLSWWYRIHTWSSFTPTNSRNELNPPPPRGGGTPLYKPYRYVPPQRVWFVGQLENQDWTLDWKKKSPFLKIVQSSPVQSPGQVFQLAMVCVPFRSENGYKLCPFWSGIGYGFWGNYGSVCFNSKWRGEFERLFMKAFCLRSNLSNNDILFLRGQVWKRVWILDARAQLSEGRLALTPG